MSHPPELTADSRDFVVANFRSLEDQLLACMDFVPFVAENQSVVSPKFIPIILDACSLIDSILRDASSDDSRHNLRSYAALHEPHLDLENATTILLVSPLRFLRPFSGWTSAPPEWWNAHNRVKHDRIKNYQSATYMHTVNALAGLHQVVARSWEFLGNLTRAGWFNESSDSFLELGAARASGAGPNCLPAHTRLFVSTVRDDLMDWTTDPPTIEPLEFTERVKAHIWEWEGW